MISTLRLKIILSSIFILVAVNVTLPHIMIKRMQISSDQNILYTPNHLNHHWTRFDDIVKLYPAFQIARHHTLTGKLTTNDHKNDWFPNVLQELIPSVLYGLVIQASNSVDSPYYILGVFVGLSFLVGFYLVYYWTSDIFISVSASLIMIFGYHFLRLERIDPLFLIHFPEIIKDIIKETGNAETNLNSFYRIHTLGASYSFFLLFIYHFYKMLQESEINRRTIIICGILVGLQFYLYLFFSLAVIGILIGALILINCKSVFRRKVNHSENLSILLIAVIGFIISIPSAWSTLHLVFSQDSLPWISRIAGDFGGSKPFVANIGLIIFALFCIIFSPNSAFRVISTSLFGVTLLVENLQFFFGFNIQPGHIYVRATLPVLILMIATSSYYVFQRLKVFWIKIYLVRMIMILAALFYFGNATWFAFSYASNTYNLQGLKKDQVELIKLVQRLQIKDKVVATLSPPLGTLLNIHSPTYLYLYFAGHQFADVKNKDIVRKLAFTFWLQKAKKADIRKYFSRRLGSKVERRYIYYYFQRYYSLSKGRNDRELVDSIYEEMKKLKIAKIRKKYLNEIDYLITGGYGVKQKIFVSFRSEFFTETTTIGEYKILKIKK